MKILGIAGSPRRGGNTDTLLDRFMEGAASKGAETKTLIVCQLKIAGCLHCDACLKKGICRIQDDMQMVYREMEAADGLVVASPLQFMTVPSELKALIDRCQALFVRKYILKVPPLGDARPRKGFLISVGGRRTIPNLFDAELVTIKTFFRTLDVRYAGDLLISGVDAKGDILKHPDQLTRAFEEGQKFVTET
ncbi:MAG: flavodoxin family protein [Dehalococcoidales bacterium]|jgi:multimeric flavodoxin WrbA|nr:flavodoxin family protein [Dehalococcoidales bacterium]